MSISNIKSKLSDWFKKNLWVIPIFILILLLTLSFCLGYLFAGQTNPAPIIIEKNSPATENNR